MRVEITATWSPEDHPEYSDTLFKVSTRAASMIDDPGTVSYEGYGTYSSISEELRLLRAFDGVEAHAAMLGPDWVLERFGHILELIGKVIWR